MGIVTRQFGDRGRTPRFIGDFGLQKQPKPASWAQWMMKLCMVFLLGSLAAYIILQEPWH